MYRRSTLPAAYHVRPQRRSRWVGTFVAGGDVIAPTATVTIVDVTKISRVSGKDVVGVTFTTDEDFVEYEVRRVSSGSDSRAAGNQVETATVSARSSHTISVTDDELVAASAVEGANILKVFVKDAAGNWST